MKIVASVRCYTCGKVKEISVDLEEDDREDVVEAFESLGWEVSSSGEGDRCPSCQSDDKYTSKKPTGLYGMHSYEKLDD